MLLARISTVIKVYRRMNGMLYDASQTRCHSLSLHNVPNWPLSYLKFVNCNRMKQTWNVCTAGGWVVFAAMPVHAPAFVFNSTEQFYYRPLAFGYLMTPFRFYFHCAIRMALENFWGVNEWIPIWCVLIGCVFLLDANYCQNVEYNIFFVLR